MSLRVVVDCILRRTGGGDTEPSLVALRLSKPGFSDMVDSSLLANLKNKSARLSRVQTIQRMSVSKNPAVGVRLIAECKFGEKSESG